MGWRRLFVRAGCLVGLAACVGLLATSSAAGSVLYYESGGSIDRLDLGGSHQPSEVVGPRDVGEGVFTIAVGGPYLYWSVVDGLDRSAIWRASLEGRGARVLIHMPSSGPHAPVIAGGHIYWSETDAIARANLDGSNVQRDFTRLPLQSSGEAVDGIATDGRYIYFSRCQDGTIGRVALDGGLPVPRSCLGRSCMGGSRSCATTPGQLALSPGSICRDDPEARLHQRCPQPLSLAVFASPS